VHLGDGGLVTIGVGIRAGATECLGPVSGESLDMLGVEAVAEHMADHVVGRHPTMPGAGKTAQAVFIGWDGAHLKGREFRSELARAGFPG